MADKIDLKEMLEAGVHFGHKKDRWNPKMRSFIFTERNGVHIFDLTITKKKLEEAMRLVEKITSEGGTVLFVGTKNQVKSIVTDAAESVGMPYLTNRWPGGMLTNFQTIVGRLKYLEETEAKTADEKSNLTKKERLSLNREIIKLKETFEGVKDMRKLPEVVFVSDIVKERIAVREAKKAGIMVIGIADSNANPDIEYVIPANDDAVKSVAYIVGKIASAVTTPKKVEEKTEAKDVKEKGEK
ncbi:MAG: 30S ribosomal protein S2 [Patescibacteria group bacterium]|nr:30S ribosomal protein S2 [Patescibacteria group bacterium]